MANTYKAYLEIESVYIHHFAQPGKSCIDEGQHSQKGNQIGCNVSNKAYGVCGSIARSFQDVPLFPVVIGHKVYATSAPQRREAPLPLRCERRCRPLVSPRVAITLR